MKNNITSSFDNKYQSITEDQFTFFKVLKNEYEAAYELLNSMPNLTLTVYGGAKLDEKSMVFKEIQEIGKELSDLGWGMVSGGGPGAMKAALTGGNRGSTPTTAMKIDLSREKTDKIANIDYLFTNFAPRKYALRQSDLYMFVPGGWGTFDELFELITLQKVDKIPHKPVILYKKDFWSGMLKWLENTVLNDGLIKAEELASFVILDTPEEVINYFKNQ
jgi:uncharacterized protein (TIGR00730 family)